MAYRKVRPGHGDPLHPQDPESEELQAPSLELEWDMEKELEEPGLDRFQLECVDRRPVGNSTVGRTDPDLEPIQPSVSPHGRFERLQEDPNYVSRFTRSTPKSQRRNYSCLAKCLLAGAGIFILGLLIGRYTHSVNDQSERQPVDSDLLQKVLQGITAEEIQALQREFRAITDKSEETKARSVAQHWMKLGLKDVNLYNYTVLLSQPGSYPNTIVDKTTNQCYLPSGERCESKDFTSNTEEQHLAFAAYSAVGSIEAEVVDVQYGSTEDFKQIRATMNVTSKIALLKIGQAPLLYKLSLLAEMGFGGVLLYVDPCEALGDQTVLQKAFGVTLNPGGDPSTPGYPSVAGNYREHRPNLTSLLVQPISSSLARELLSAPAAGQGRPCIPFVMSLASGKKIVRLTVGNQASYKTVFNVIGYLKGKTNPDRYVLMGSRHGSWYDGSLADWQGGAAILTHIISTLMMQTRSGWHPDRTILFCSWGGSDPGSIGSFEWGEENGVALQSRAVAYVGLHSPIRTGNSLQATASPSVRQLAIDILKRQQLKCGGAGGCPGPNVSSLQTPGDTNFFANVLAVPTVEFTSATARTAKAAGFLPEVFYPSEPGAGEMLDPSFRLHQTVAKMTAEALLRLSTDPVLPFYPLDIALDIQNKLKDDPLANSELLALAASLRDSSEFFQSEVMRPANDPKERDPAHVRMLNDALRDLEKSFLVPNPPPGFYRNILYGLTAQSSQFSILKDAWEIQKHSAVNQSLTLVSNAINSAKITVQCGLDLFQNNPDNSH
ncbi:inactive N-acetylated-alpha-linked acidic dipeptidase-like protein 2 [Chanos chanos]|uniref:Inactive N-acetylated-alpha-linked acidic dipeptidase-like protein 2 n=1 Tax=Chanos chanos TaxID=29144 RepID=A0A6J2WU98_CHACN|nr:inactive N-acetylated-alpha-linked acidic dipeptidase-like protein 2 [Chanos chanos]